MMLHRILWQPECHFLTRSPAPWVDLDLHDTFFSGFWECLSQHNYVMCTGAWWVWGGTNAIMAAIEKFWLWKNWNSPQTKFKYQTEAGKHGVMDLVMRDKIRRECVTHSTPCVSVRNGGLCYVPFIHLFSFAYLELSSRRQQPRQESLDFPLPSYFIQLLRWDPKALPGQPRDI